MIGRATYGALLALLFVLLAGCGELTPVAPDAYTFTHTVRSGETLFSIAFDYGYDYREIAAWNEIPPPYTIFVGQQLVVIQPYGRRIEPPPVATESPLAVEDRPPPSTSAPGGATASPPVVVRPLRRDVVENRRPAPTSSGIPWQWPTDGKILERFNASGGKKGLDIGGKTGQVIRASAAGSVVYSGSGLLGYGNLVIIKHDDVYLSAYGHNQTILVKEGDRVAAGQKIAEMGETTKLGPVLHFEIRRDGKPEDPLRYLPSRN